MEGCKSIWISPSAKRDFDVFRIEKWLDILCKPIINKGNSTYLKFTIVKMIEN